MLKTRQITLRSAMGFRAPPIAYAHQRAMPRRRRSIALRRSRSHGVVAIARSNRHQASLHNPKGNSKTAFQLAAHHHATKHGQI
eukprot:5286021-Pyramimonas_sp.AAC.1